MGDFAPLNSTDSGNGERIARVGTWIWHLNDNRLRWSEQTYRNFGVSPQSFVPTFETFLEAIHPDDRPMMREWCRACKAGERPGGLQFRVIHPDGSVRTLEGNGELQAATPNTDSFMIGTAQDVSERKQIEERLIAAEARFRAIVEATIIPKALNDDHQRITFLNPAFVKTFGYNLWDIPTLHDWWPKAYPDPEYRKWVIESWVAEMERSKRTKTPFSPMELKVTCKDGSVKYILASAASLDQDYKGEHLVILYDITAHKKSEAALNAAAARQIAILNALPAHIALIDSKGIILAVNESWRRFASANTLRSADFFVGHNYLHICEEATGECSEEARQVSAGLRDVLSGKSPIFTLEYPCHSPAEKRWFRLMATPLSDSQEFGVVVMHVNVTDRMLALNALQKSEAKFASAFDHAAIGMALISQQGKWLRVNPGLCAFLGYSNSDLMTRNFRDVFHPDEITDSENHIRQLQSGEIKTHYSEMRFLHRAGHVIWGLLNLTLVNTTGGEEDFFVVEIVDITARKKAEAELLLEKEFSQSIINGLSYLICVVDMSGKIVAVNQAWRVFAIKSGTMLQRVSVGRNYLAICDTALGKDSVAARNFASGIRDVLAGTRENHVQEYVAHGIKGNRRLIGKVTRFSSVDKHYAIIAHEDVSEWRKTENELRIIEKRLALALESVNDGIWDWDLESGRVERNDRFYSMLGYDSDVWPSNEGAWKANVHPEDIGHSEVALHRCLSGSVATYEVEYRLRRKDGSWCWVLSRGRVVQRDKKGAPLRMVGTLTDITQRKLAELSLSESEEQLRSVLSTAAEGIILINDTGIIKLFNRAAERIFGYEADEILGSQIETLMPSPHRENHAGYLKNFLKTGKPGIIGVGRELAGVRKDGSSVPIYLNVSEATRTGEKFFTGIVRDLSEEKRKEAERIALEKRVAQSQKMESLGVLAGGIAHDFNNILTSIMGFAEIAKDKATEKIVVHALNQVLGASMRARNLIKQVLMFSRTDSAQLKPIDLVRSIREVLEEIVPALPTNIRLQSDIATERCWILGDASQIHQILLNLITNAHQAMPSGGRLSISLAVQWEYGKDPTLQQTSAPYAQVTISDNGIGIDPDIQHRIFEPFFSTKGIKGTGLGLSVVHGIVKKHGGSIQVDSKPGAGSTFTVLLPIVEATRPDSDLVATRQIVGFGKVLVIDDDEMVLEMISEMFKQLGFEVDAFADPADALEALASNRTGYRALVSDYTMSSMNGLESIERARQIAPELPAILMTGHGDTIVYEKSRSDFILLTKPFRIMELNEVLNIVLAH